MACCGRGLGPPSETRFTAPEPARSAALATAGVDVIFLGAGTGRLTSASTGRVYVFSAHRRRFTVDPRDVGQLAADRRFMLAP